MPDPIESLMQANLLEVFNERDEAKRREAIARTYSDSVRWVDSEGVTTGRDALDAKCVGLQSGLGDLQFVAAGPIHQLPGFGYLAWSLVDPADGHVKMSGFDVATVADGVIVDLYTVLTPPAE